jgi:hypothetical protein
VEQDMNKKAFVSLILAIVAYSNMLVSWDFTDMTISAIVCCLGMLGFFIFFDPNLRWQSREMAIFSSIVLCLSCLSRLPCLLVRRVSKYGRAKDKKTGGEP